MVDGMCEYVYDMLVRDFAIVQNIFSTFVHCSSVSASEEKYQKENTFKTYTL